MPLVATGLLCAAGVTLPATAASQMEVLVVALVLMGLSQGVWTLIASATAAEFGARCFGRAFGIVCAFAPIGSLAPLLVAGLREQSGGYAVRLLSLGALTVCGALAGLMLRERKPEARPPMEAIETVGAGA